MKFQLLAAYRYLFSGKSQNVINLISAVSVAGIAVGTMCMIIILSAMNGLSQFMTSLYQSFDPQVKITSRTEKTFEFTDSLESILGNDSNVASFSKVLEDDALLLYGDEQYFITLKGCDENFKNVCDIGEKVVSGSYLGTDQAEECVIGQVAASYLRLDGDFPLNASILAPSHSPLVLTPDRAFHRREVSISGIFSIEEEANSRYALTSLGFAQNLFNTAKISSVYVNPSTTADKAIASLKKSLGGYFNVLSLQEQKADFYKVVRSEKLAIVFILAFILIISSFNVLGSLSMLVIEKERNIHSLRNMGADQKLILRIFRTEGWMISWLGVLAGLFLGWLVCYLQMRLGLVRIGNSGGFLFDAYPVLMKFWDFVLTAVIVLTVGWVATLLPSKILVKKYCNGRRSE